MSSPYHFEKGCPIKNGYRRVKFGIVIEGDYVRNGNGTTWLKADGLKGRGVVAIGLDGWQVCRKVD